MGVTSGTKTVLVLSPGSHTMCVTSGTKTVLVPAPGSHTMCVTSGTKTVLVLAPGSHTMCVTSRTKTVLVLSPDPVPCVIAGSYFVPHFLFAGLRAVLKGSASYYRCVLIV